MAVQLDPRRDRPRLRRFLNASQSYWVRVEPARIAPIGGTLCLLAAMVYYLLRQLFHMPLDLIIMAKSALLAFLAGYAVTGLLVYYVLHLIEAERPLEDEETPEEVNAPVAGEAPAEETEQR